MSSNLAVMNLALVVVVPYVLVPIVAAIRETNAIDRAIAVSMYAIHLRSVVSSMAMDSGEPDMHGWERQSNKTTHLLSRLPRLVGEGDE